MYTHVATPERLLYCGEPGPANAGPAFADLKHDTIGQSEVTIIAFNFDEFSVADGNGRNTTKEEFDALADKWELETQHLSSVSAKRKHHAYQAIKRMGDKVLPWVLARLRPDGASWFYLLDELVGNPPEIERGNVRRIILAWKKWGREHGPSA